MGKCVAGEPARSALKISPNALRRIVQNLLRLSCHEDVQSDSILDFVLVEGMWLDNF